MPDTAATRAALALALVRRDPALGGVVLRARSGPVRDALTAPAAGLPRLHPQTEDEALFGGVDLTATLAAGRIARRAGLLGQPGGAVLTMAERIAPGLAGRLAASLDADPGQWFLALDEGASEDETCPAPLAERLAFRIDLTDARMADLAGLRTDWPGAVDAASVRLPADMAEAVAGLTVRLGIGSARAAAFTLRAARGIAALRGGAVVEAADLETAAALVLPHRATRFPESEAEPEPEPPPEDAAEDVPEDAGTPGEALPAEMLLEAIAALIPPDLLDRLAARKARTGTGAGTGARRKGNRRGRPLPSRPGRPGNGARVDIIATLRAAAPWQSLRGRAGPRPVIRRADLHVRRFQVCSDRLLIFVVDASGSAALARLAEAKGAVEILLAEAYARRDHVALIAFRGAGAETLLPPTRSLVQTKRRLAALPGGGGTPLAAGLRAALAEVDHARRHGMTPTVCLLTDGRANVALDGSPDRAAAAEDARSMARLLAGAGADALVIDTGRRPEPALAELAALLAAPYLPMPRADAERVSAAVASALGS